MRAVWTTGTNGPDSLEVRESQDPEPKAGQVRIRVRAAGLCFAEVMAAQGLYPGAPRFPAVLGYEAAGEIDQAGPGVRIGRLVSRMDLLTQELTEVLALWAAGTITPRIDATYPFAQAADAHRRILSHGNTGKVILTP